jgi:hypothetical protein
MMKRIGAVEAFYRGAVGRFDEEKAANHGRAVVRGERPGYHDADAERARVGQERLVVVIVQEPRVERARLVDGMNHEEHPVLPIICGV